MSTLLISENALGMIREYEGFRSKAYLCSAGRWTIGYGTTQYQVIANRKVKQGDVISKKDAERELAAYNQKVLARLQVKGISPKNTKQHELDALLSFAYNFGTDALLKSTLLKKHLAGDKKGAAAEFLLWVNAGGKFNKGLQNRRKKEVAIYEGVSV